MRIYLVQGLRTCSHCDHETGLNLLAQHAIYIIIEQGAKRERRRDATKLYRASEFCRQHCLKFRWIPRILGDYQNGSLSMKAECPYPIFDRLPFRLACSCSLPFESIFFPNSAFSCTWCGVGYNLGYVAKVEVESNILEFCWLGEVDYVGLPSLAVG